MFGDAIRCTSSTGGSSTLTLNSVTGWPQPTDVFGASGTMLVEYQISEYTDSTLSVLSKFESGRGSLVLSTNVLTRSVPKVTWTSGGSYNKITASALTFGSTAANIMIVLSANARTQMGELPIVQSSSGSGFSGNSLGMQSFNTRQQMNSNNGTKVLTNGDRIWVPSQLTGGLITSVGVKVTTLHAGGLLRLGLYDWDTDGLAGNLLQEFTSATQIDLTATGLRSVTAASKMYPVPGWYWYCLQSNDSTAAITVADVNGASGMGMSTGERENMYYTKSATFGALPATGDKTASSITTKSSGGQPWAGFV